MKPCDHIWKKERFGCCWKYVCQNPDCRKILIESREDYDRDYIKNENGTRTKRLENDNVLR